MFSWLYCTRGHSDPTLNSLLFFFFEIFFIPFYLGIIFRSIFLFFYLLIVIILGIFYFNIRIISYGIVFLAFVIFGVIGWIVGSFISSFLFSPSANLIGGILGAAIFGLFALILNNVAFDSSWDSTPIRYKIFKTDFIVYLIFIIGIPLIFTRLLFP